MRARMTDNGDTGKGNQGQQRAAGPRAPRGREDAARLFNVPPVVAYTALALAAVFAAFSVAPRAVVWLLGGSLGLSPARFFAGPIWGGDGGILAWLAPLFTHILIHASLAHLLFNSLWFVVFGTPVARRLGNAPFFLLFFALSGAAGALFFSAFHASDPTILVGASGGVTGLLGGLVRFAFQNPAAGPVVHRVPLMDRSVLVWSAVVIAINASVAVVGPGFGAGGVDVAWQAHVGGYLFGLIAFPLFDRRG